MTVGVSFFDAFLPQISLRNLRKLDCYANRYPLRLKTLPFTLRDEFPPRPPCAGSSHRTTAGRDCQAIACATLRSVRPVRAETCGHRASLHRPPTART